MPEGQRHLFVLGFGDPGMGIMTDVMKTALHCIKPWRLLFILFTSVGAIFSGLPHVLLDVFPLSSYMYSYLIQLCHAPTPFL